MKANEACASTGCGVHEWIWIRSQARCARRSTYGKPFLSRKANDMSLAAADIPTALPPCVSLPRKSLIVAGMCAVLLGTYIEVLPLCSRADFASRADITGTSWLRGSDKFLDGLPRRALFCQSQPLFFVDAFFDTSARPPTRLRRIAARNCPQLAHPAVVLDVTTLPVREFSSTAKSRLTGSHFARPRSKIAAA